MSYDTYKVNNKPLIETAEMDFIGADAFLPIEANTGTNAIYCYNNQALKSYNGHGDSHYNYGWEATRAIGDAYHKYYTYGTSKPKPIGREIDVSTMVNFGKIITIAGKAGTYNFFINRNTKSWECTYTDTNGITSTFFNNRNLNYFGNAAGKVGKLPSRFIIALWGAGGGGGGSPEWMDPFFSLPGAGGGSGAFWCGVINTDANWRHEFTVTIGTGGRGGFNTNNTNADGIDGGYSSISITDDDSQTSTLTVGGGKGGKGGGYAGTSIGGAGGTITSTGQNNYLYDLPIYAYTDNQYSYQHTAARIAGNSGGNAGKPGGNYINDTDNDIRVYSGENYKLASNLFALDTTYTNEAGKWYTSLFSTPGGTGTRGGGGASAVSIQLSLGELLADEDGSAVAAKWTNGFKSCGGNGATAYNTAGSNANNGSTDTTVPGGMGAGGGGAGGCTGRAKIAGGNGYNGAMILFALDDLTTVGADIK